MRIALATCRNLPAWERDDRPLHAALRGLGVDVRLPAWDDAAFDFGACDACLIRTTWDYVERRGEFVAWAERVGAACPLFNRPEIVRWNTDKTYLRELEARGVAIVPTVWLERGAEPDIGRLLADRGWTRGFLKPVFGSTARETLRFDARGEGLAQAQRHADRLLRREALMLQPYYDTVETWGEGSVIFVAGRMTHAVRKVPRGGDYRVQDDFGACDEPYAPSAAEQAWAHDVLERAPHGLLYARVDLLRDEQGAPRLTELELVEPSLFFRHAPHAAEGLAEALCRAVRAGAPPAARTGAGAARPPDATRAASGPTA
jgi:hypothetical protein